MPEAIRVLVVDDDVDVRRLLTAVLSRPPMTVVEAASGGIVVDDEDVNGVRHLESW